MIMDRTKWAKQVLMVATMVTMLSACASDRAPQPNFGMRYQHAPTLTKHTQTLPLAFDSKGRVGVVQKAEIKTFAHNFIRNGTAPLTIAVGSRAGQARALKRVQTLQSLLRRQGVHDTEMRIRYSSKARSTTAVLSYDQILARPSPCGNFLTDPQFNPRNMSDYNMGCAIDNNVTLMIRNPADLNSSRQESGNHASRQVTTTNIKRVGN